MRITEYDHVLISKAVKHFCAEDMQTYSDSVGWELLDRQAIAKARSWVGKYQTDREYSDAEQGIIDALDSLYCRLHLRLFPATDDPPGLVVTDEERMQADYDPDEEGPLPVAGSIHLTLSPNDITILNDALEAYLYGLKGMGAESPAVETLKKLFSSYANGI